MLCNVDKYTANGPNARPLTSQERFRCTKASVILTTTSVCAPRKTSPLPKGGALLAVSSWLVSCTIQKTK